MNSDRIRVVALFVLSALACRAAYAQTQTGAQPFSSFGGGSFDTINLGDLDVHFCIPVVSKAGRGLPFNYSLCYDSSIWFPDSSSGVTTWAPVKNWGWRSQTDAATGYLYNSSATTTCLIPGTRDLGGSTTTYKSWIYYDNNGTSHPFSGFTKVVVNFGGTGNTCPPDQTTSLTATANDGSGYTLHATAGSGYVVARNGTQFNPLPINAPTGAGTVQDRNGNQLSISSSGVFTDTLGKTALTITGTTNIGSSSSPTYYTYTGESGAEKVTITYKQYSVRAAFGCTSPNAFGPTTEYLVDRITLPDQSYYGFAYELDADQTHFPGTVTARIYSVSLPTGGTIKYTYSGGTNGIFCSDGTTAGFARNTPDGTSHYTRTAANSNHVGTTSVTDGAGNVSTYSFYEPTGQPPYEIERQAKTGSSSLLETIITCYNGQTPSSSCATTPTAFTSISDITRYIQLPDSTGIQSEVDESYNSYGLLTARNEYDFGSGTPTRKRFIAYGSYANGNCTNTETTALNTANIFTAVCEDITTDGANNWQAGTLYTYDQNPVSPSGATQHATVTGARGNPTTLYIMKTAGGAAYLYKQFTYFDTGLPQTFTDTNGDPYTYTYGACDAAFLTNVSEPAGLSRSMTWDDPTCNGAVPMSVTDEAGAKMTLNYSGEYFWRPSSIADAMTPANTTTFSYSPTTFESALTFNNGTSTVDKLVTFDSLGRTHVSQQRQGPGSPDFDTVETDYNANGQVSRVTMPWQGTAGATSAQASATTYTYDGLGRVLTATDGGGGQIQHIYSQNTFTTSLYPTPTGETNKSTAYQYDGLGRVINVCEGTSGTAGGTCGFNGWAGFWTQYSYDVLGDLTGVTQNAQGTPQTRSYAYDAMRRLTSETNPESGTTTYTYDASQTGAGAGDLYTKKDANNVTLTYTYGALHRLLTASTGSFCRTFVYDSSTGPNSGTGYYLLGRLTEAATTNCASTTYTNEYFGYDADGRTTDSWESTPNSGGLYHVTDQYFPNGVANTLLGYQASGSLIGGLPTIAYGVDGEGRPTTVTAGSGQNPVTTASYYTVSQSGQSAGQLASVTYGSGDSDNYQYDSATGRMTQYQFAVNGSNLTGALTWNANGTLQKLAITDPFNSSDAQTCTYSYDPVVRVASANCGSAWSQTFTYDFAGNIKKSGSLSFQPNYLDASGKTNNQYNSGLTGLSYDADGNLRNDSFHSYTWDAFGGVTAIDSYPITHDAFGRIVEFKSSPTYQILYAPTGLDLAVMNGQTIFYGKVPLPSGGRAVFTGSGLNDYTHVDWQGSARFGSTTSRGMLFDMAYAPYGEIYAKTGGGSAEAFTGQYRDIVGDEWDFLYRQEHSSQGRWISPDPAGLAAVDPMNPQTWNRYAYVGGNPLANVDPDGLVTLPGCEEGDWGCGLGGGGWGGCGALGGPEGDLCTLMLPPPSVLGGDGGGSGSGGSGGGGGGTSGSGGGTNGSGGAGGRIANFPNGESLGIPPGVSANWGGIWGALLPIDPSCEFGPCVPMASGYATGVSGAGTPDSPFKISVFVWAGTHLCGEFWCDEHGNFIGPAPDAIQGLHPTYVEFDLLLGGFYLSDINSNPLLRMGPGYVKGGRKIFRIVTGGPGVSWWKHIWDGPPWPW